MTRIQASICRRFSYRLLLVLTIAAQSFLLANLLPAVRSALGASIHLLPR